MQSTQCPATLSVDGKQQRIQSNHWVCAYTVAVHILQLLSVFREQGGKVVFLLFLHLRNCLWIRKKRTFVYPQWINKPHSHTGWFLSVNPGRRLKCKALGRLLICVQILCCSNNISIFSEKKKKEKTAQIYHRWLTNQPCTFFLALLCLSLSVVGGGEWLRWKPQHHQDLPGV